MTRTAIVIGAGAAGLATAGLLAREGYRVTVVEKNDTYGGRAGCLEDAGLRWDTGPSWYLMPDAFDRFYELMGTSTAAELDLVQLTDPAYRVFPENHDPLDVPAGRGNVEALFEAIEPGAGQALSEHLDSAEDTYRISMAHFLYTNFTSPRPFLHRDVLTRLGLLARLLTTSLDTYVARRFTDTRLRQILTFPAVFLSTRPEKTPALYHLMSHTDLTQGVFYPRGGFHAVMTSLYRLALDHGVEFRFSTPVSAISPSGVQVDGGELHADIVVSCADLHHTETSLLPERWQTYREKWFSRRDPGLGTVLVMLGVRGSLPELAHHNLFFSEDWSPDFDAVFGGRGYSRSLYVSKPSATDEGVAPEGCENLFILVPVQADAGFDQVEEVAEAAIALIAARSGVADLAERIVVKHTVGPADFARGYHAWSGGSIGPSHTLKQSAFLRGRNKSRKVEGLYYAGASTVPGVGVPLCLISAENLVDRLRGDMSFNRRSRT